MGPLEQPPTPPDDDDDVTCPWCRSTDVSQVRDFGSLLMTSQWFCAACSSPFERIKLRGSDEDTTA